MTSRIEFHPIFVAMQKFRCAYFTILFLTSIQSRGQTKQDCKISGVNIVSPKHYTSTDYLKSVKRINANWVALVPYAFMETGNPEIRYNCDQNWWGGTLKGLKNSSKLSKKNDLKVLLKPHFWLDNEKWAGEISFKEKDWKKWESNYRSFILKMAEIAENHSFEILCIGTEMKSAVLERPGFWKLIIKEIKAHYSGKLVYAANWDNFKNIPFWNEIDYIGVDAYFPLSEQVTPSVGELITS